MQEGDAHFERAVRFPRLSEVDDLVDDGLDVARAVERVVGVLVQRFQDVLGTSLGPML
jgi:hypothetical protein